MSEYQSTFSIPGISSQIDWGAMADKLLENARKPIVLWEAQQDTLELKIGLFNEFSAGLKTLRTAVTPLKLDSIFKAKTAQFSAASGLDPAGIVSATVDASAAIARHEIEVIQKAFAETRFSEQISTTMGDADLSGPSTFSINVGGRRADIEVLTSDTLRTIADKINAAKDSTIDPATGQPYNEGVGVVATVLDDRLVLKSVSTGLGERKEDWTVKRGTTGDLDRLGFTAASGTGFTVTADSGGPFLEGTDYRIVAGSDQIEWLTTKRPATGVEYTVSFTVESNAFTITGDTDIIDLLKLNDDSSEYHIAAQDAEFRVDGLLIKRPSNEVDDLLEGVKLSINGPGTVIMDITQDAEQAVNAMKDFVDTYNDVMDWINIRLSESTQEDSDDDFTKKFGLLHGNSMLWQSKSQLRMLVTNPILSKFTQKTGSTILGSMASQGLSGNSSFQVTVGVRTANIEITPNDTLSSIASKINSSYEMTHDTEGRVYPIPMASAKVVNNQLVIEASSGRKFSLSGSSEALETIGLGTPFSLLSQIGLSTESDDYGKSGKIEFDQNKLMEALTKDPDSVAALMTTLMEQMDDYIDNMVSNTQQEIGTASVPKGRISSQIYSYQSEITLIGKRISNLERRLEVRARGLYESFASAEVRLAELQQQASWLASVIAQLQTS